MNDSNIAVTRTVKLPIESPQDILIYIRPIRFRHTTEQGTVFCTIPFTEDVVKHGNAIVTFSDITQDIQLGYAFRMFSGTLSNLMWTDTFMEGPKSSSLWDRFVRWFSIVKANGEYP